MKNIKISTILSFVSLILIIAILGGIIYGYYKKHNLHVENPVVTMEIEKFGTVKIELYPNIAPDSVSNFIRLAQNGMYNGLKFHRVVDGFMIQGGDPEGTGAGSPTFGNLYKNEDENKKYKYSNGKEASSSDKYTITGEFIANGYYDNKLELSEGTIAMARSDYTLSSPTLTEESYNSAGSQFFIMTTNEHTDLTGYYAGFGKVIEGIDVVKAVEKVECKAANEQENNEDGEKSTDSRRNFKTG